MQQFEGSKEKFFRLLPFFTIPDLALFAQLCAIRILVTACGNQRALWREFDDVADPWLDPPRRQSSSERAQEVQHVLLLAIRQLVEIPDHAVCLGIRALMCADGRQQIARPPVMQEKDPLTKTPKRRRPEFVAGGGALKHAVGEIPPHPMQGKVGEGMECRIVEGLER